MGIIIYIRERKRLLSSVLGIILCAFILSNTGTTLNWILQKKHITDVGTIAGEKVSYNEYCSVFYRYKQNLLAQYPGYDVDKLAHDRAWEEMKANYLYRRAYQKIGIQVPLEEQKEMILGDENFVNKDLKKYFTNPQTGKFEKEKLIEALQSLKKAAGGDEALKQMLEDYIEKRKKEKMAHLVQHTCYVTQLQAAQTQANNQKIKVQYISGPIQDLPTVPRPTKEEEKAYLKAHPKDFQLPEERGIQFVILRILPSEEDKNRTKEKIKRLGEVLKTHHDPKTFARHHTDGSKQVAISFKQKEIPAEIGDVKRLRKNPLTKPIYRGGEYIVYLYTGSPKDLWRNTTYHFVKIVQKVTPSQRTEDDIYTQAEDLKKQIKNLTQWKKVTSQQGLTTHEITIDRKRALNIGSKDDNRDLVTWVWKQEKLGEVSPPIRVGESYVVAIFAQHQKKGNAPLPQVGEKVTARIMHDRRMALKAKRLQEINTADQSLQKIAKALGPKVTVKTQTIRPTAHSLDGIRAPKAIGAAFALQPGQRTIVQEKDEVFIIERLSPDHTNAPNPAAVKKQQAKLLKQQKELQRNMVFPAIEQEFGPVNDERYRFF